MRKLDNYTIQCMDIKNMAEKYNYQYGNSLFGKFGTLFESDSCVLYIIAKVEYNKYDTTSKKSGFLSETEADKDTIKDMFNSDSKYANEFTKVNGTVAGGF